MIVAGIHGGYEWNTIALADQLTTILPGRPDLIPHDVTLFILRSLNPDGDARSHDIYGRANENGVDLNRNWPAHWQAEWPRNGCWDMLPITAGTYPASEPETLALMRFLPWCRFLGILGMISRLSGGTCSMSSKPSASQPVTSF